MTAPATGVASALARRSPVSHRMVFLGTPSSRLLGADGFATGAPH
jgi:hypothetical protein